MSDTQWNINATRHQNEEYSQLHITGIYPDLTRVRHYVCKTTYEVMIHEGFFFFALKSTIMLTVILALLQMFAFPVVASPSSGPVWFSTVWLHFDLAYVSIVSWTRPWLTGMGARWQQRYHLNNSLTLKQYCPWFKKGQQQRKYSILRPVVFYHWRGQALAAAGVTALRDWSVPFEVGLSKFQSRYVTGNTPFGQNYLYGKSDDLHAQLISS